MLAQRLQKVKPSPTIVITNKAKELKAAGRDIIVLGAGEPDFDTPQNIKDYAIKAINAGKTRYTAVDGTKELKQAIIAKLKRENGLEYSENQITVGAGAKQVIFNLFMATVNPGDEVIVPAPYWVSYPDIAMLFDGKPVIIESGIENNFKISATALEKAITPKTKWLVLNSPNNPSGVCYSKEDLAELGAVLKKHPHVNIMSDDIYEHVIYAPSKFYNIAMACPELKDRTFVVNGVSKSYSMTGWRIGYGAGNAELIKAICTLQSQSTTNPSSVSQEAAIEALNGTQDFISVNAKNFEKKRDIVLEGLKKIDGIECVNPGGAFYVFPSVKKLIGKTTPQGKKLESCTDFSNFLLEEGSVAVVPGSAFGMNGYFRLSYATSEEELHSAMKRIADAVAKLK